MFSYIASIKIQCGQFLSNSLWWTLEYTVLKGNESYKEYLEKWAIFFDIYPGGFQWELEILYCLSIELTLDHAIYNFITAIVKKRPFWWDHLVFLITHNNIWICICVSLLYSYLFIIKNMFVYVGVGRLWNFKFKDYRKIFFLMLKVKFIFILFLLRI